MPHVGSWNLGDLFEAVAAAVPAREAVVAGEVRLSFAALDERANRLAAVLAERGVGPGDHVALAMRNGNEYLEGMLGAFKLRAVPVNVNTRYTIAELRYLLDDADPKVVLHDPDLAARIDAALAARPVAPAAIVRGEAYEAALAAAPAQAPTVEGRSGDDRYLLYTGGTTGLPKGVVWRHEDVFYALGGGVDAYTNERVTHGMQLAEKAAASEAPMVTLNAPPLMHGAAQWGALRFFFEGNTVVFVPKFSAEAIWDAVEKDKVSTLVITGDAMARPLTEALEAEPDRWDLSSMFVLSSSAAIFSPTLKRRMFDLLPNIIIVDAIGSSESGMNGMVVMTKDETISQSGGGPTVKAGRDAVVLDEDLRPLAPGTGEVGKLARGGNIPIGYYKDPKKTAETFVTAPDGTRYVVAGDFARLEEDGTITLLGRGSVCINSGGEKIYPEEVEGVLKALPSVYDTLVVGVPDDRWGQAVCAVVQARDGSTPTLEELQAHAHEHLARYKAPRHLVLVPEIQRSPSGKPDYPWATELARAAVGSDA